MRLVNLTILMTLLLMLALMVRLRIPQNVTLVRLYGGVFRCCGTDPFLL